MSLQLVVPIRRQNPLPGFDPPELLADEGDYVISVATATAPMTPSELRSYLAKNGSLIQYMEPVGSIAPPVERMPISGAWPEKGARRRLIQADGHQLLERSLKNEITDFRYQAFGFTSGAGRGVDHIYADWSLEPIEQGTRFEWTYRVAPKTRLFVRLSSAPLSGSCSRSCKATMDRMAAAVRSAKADQDIDE